MAYAAAATTTLAVLALIFAMAGSSGASYCVCKTASDAVLQKALDYACGNGADCTTIRPNGACYNPNSVQSHCSYAVNSYYQKKSSTGGTCDFEGVATLTNSPPSGMCSSSGGGGGSSAPGSTSSPTITTPGTTPVTPVSSSGGSSTPTSSSSSPYMTPGTGTGIGAGTGSPSSTGVLGGVGSGLAPTGVGMNDESEASRPSSGSILASAVLSCSLAILCL